MEDRLISRIKNNERAMKTLQKDIDRMLLDIKYLEGETDLAKELLELIEVNNEA